MATPDRNRAARIWRFAESAVFLKRPITWLTLMSTLCCAPVSAETYLNVVVPGTATVRIDGDPVSTGSVTLVLEPGEYLVTVELSDGRRFTERVHSPSKWFVLKRIQIRKVEPVKGLPGRQAEKGLQYIL